MYPYTANVSQLTWAINRLTKALDDAPIIGKISRGCGTWVFEDDTEYRYVVHDNGKVVRETRTSWRDNSGRILLDAE